MIVMVLALSSAKVDEIFDVGDPEPPNAVEVESLAWVNYGWGDGPTLGDEYDADDPEVDRLLFGRTYQDEWKFYLGGKMYIDWLTLVRRFGPVRVTRIM